MIEIPKQLDKKITDKYKVERNTFLYTTKNDWRDRIETEIGDSKQDDFLPQIKIKRWDNEVNCSIRLKGFDNYSIKTEDDKIKLDDGKKEVHFYDIAPNTELDEGGYEFEVILKERPLTNKIEFSLNTKGLDFRYQRPLTQAQKDKGMFAAENVFGSYAIYTSEEKINFDDGKIYKNGKVGHIYRPKIIDSVGNWVWGDLSIDKEKGILSVTISEKFLDEAIYPVRHAAGLTYGYTSHGAYWYQAGAEKIFMNYKETAPDDDYIISQLSAWCKENIAGSVNAKGVLMKYVEPTNEIITNGISSPGSIDSSTGAQLDCNFGTSPTLANGSNYFLCVVNESNDFFVAFDDGQTDYAMDWWSNSYSSPTANSAAPGDLYADYALSIWVTYTTGGGGTETDDERDSEVKGIDTSDSDRPSETIGESTSNAERNVEIRNQAFANSEKSSEIIAGIVPNLSAAQVDAKIRLTWTYGP